MASASSSHVCLPLSDSTHGLNLQEPSSTYPTTKSQTHQTSSYRTLHPHVDSSESEISQHSSIYDAEVYFRRSSENSRGEEPKGAFEWEHEAPLPPAILDWDRDNSGETVLPDGDWDNSESPMPPPWVRPKKSKCPISPPASPPRRSWASPSLATIIEQRSFATLRSAHSFPRLSSNTGTASSGIMTPKEPNAPGVILATIPETPPKSSSISPSKSRRRKSVSLDDLSLSSFKATLKSPICSQSSSSSEDDKQSAAHIINYPNVPFHPPLSRSPTPPGLPSFGTREALRYQPRDPIVTPEPLSPNSNTAPTPSKHGMLGFFRRAFAVPESPPRSIGLPPGVIARAADGTLVRGRFGIRQSGHMGLTGETIALERHPWHRDMQSAEVSATLDGGEAGRKVVRFNDEVEVARSRTLKTKFKKTEKEKKRKRQARAGQERAQQSAVDRGGPLSNSSQLRTPSEAFPQSILVSSEGARSRLRSHDSLRHDQSTSRPNSSNQTPGQIHDDSPILTGPATWQERLYSRFETWNNGGLSREHVQQTVGSVRLIEPWMAPPGSWNHMHVPRGAGRPFDPEFERQEIAPTASGALLPSSNLDQDTTAVPARPLADVPTPGSSSVTEIEKMNTHRTCWQAVTECWEKGCMFFPLCCCPCWCPDYSEEELERRMTMRPRAPQVALSSHAMGRGAALGLIGAVGVVTR